MKLESDERHQARRELAEAIDKLALPIIVRQPEEWAPIDDSVFYARSEARELFVLIHENVGWGPNIDSYVNEAHEDRPVPIMMIGVPNSMAGRTHEVVDLIRNWFAP